MDVILDSLKYLKQNSFHKPTQNQHKIKSPKQIPRGELPKLNAEVTELGKIISIT